MRRISWICLVLLGLFGGAAEAQQSASAKATVDRSAPADTLKRWDVAASAALFNASPAESEGFFQDDWYFQGRYAAAIGYYWTEHLKTEVEYAISGEGSVFMQEYRRPAGQSFVYPYSVEALHRLEQASVRMVYQFGENSWLHPYVSAGLVGDRDRLRVHIPEQFQYPSGRVNERVLVIPEVNQGPTYDYRIGYSIGAGLKIYMTSNSFFTTGANFTHSRPASTFSWLAGFGVDF